MLTSRGYAETVQTVRSKPFRAGISQTKAECNITVENYKFLRTYRVLFETNGHGTAIKEQKIVYSGRATRPDDPSEEGYIFGGWFSDDKFKNEFNFNTSIITDITLYAKWIKGDSDKITGDVNDDGKVTKYDAVMLYKKTINGDKFVMPIESCEDYMLYADMDKDEVLTTNDAAMILEMIEK